AGAPMVGHLHTEMQRLMRKLLGKFVSTQAIAAAKDVTSVNFLDDEVQHQDSIIAIGLKTRQYLQDNEETLPPGTPAKFFRHVRLFYTSLASSLLKKFPFNDDILKTLSFLNPETREKTSAEAVVQLGMRVMPDLNAESLLEEVAEFHITHLEDLPPYRETVQPEDPTDEPREIITEDSLQKFWVYMRDRQLSGRSQRQFPTIPKVALACLAIPHSNADPERCFSILRKIQTDSRSRLTSETIHNLLSVKFNEHNICSSFVPSK
ncbi:hypothetical protein MAR_029375, partial [Mya arenaria]